MKNKYIHKISISIFRILILIPIVISSCSKARDYEFVVYNATDYKIDIFKIGSGKRKIEISVKPNDTSEVFVYEFDGTYFNFTEPLLGLHVYEYSDSINTYNNGIGQLASIPDLRKKSTNIIDISLREDAMERDCIFEIKVNK